MAGGELLKRRRGQGPGGHGGGIQAAAPGTGKQGRAGLSAARDLGVTSGTGRQVREQGRGQHAGVGASQPLSHDDSVSLGEGVEGCKAPLRLLSPALREPQGRRGALLPALP